MKLLAFTFLFLISSISHANNLICLGTYGDNEGEVRITIWENAQSGLMVYAEEVNEDGDWAEASAQLISQEQPPFILYLQNSESAGFLGSFALQFDPNNMVASMELTFSPLGNENLFIEAMNCTVQP